uniref:Uncharacterized protein n=1 Tax=Xiphophorus couchianus TaxID=32473 RepID=A0A3B5LU38_9TELE
MDGYTGLRSCTWTESPAHIFHNSSVVGQSHAESCCDLVLLTFVLIGSYRLCIVPLLTAFHGNGRKLWRRDGNSQVAVAIYCWVDVLLSAL